MAAVTEKKVLDHVLGKTELVFSSGACYMGICTNATPGDPTMATPGTFTELTIGSNGYTREQVAAANWNAATQSGTNPSQSTIISTVEFGPCTTSDWGTCYGWALFDASTSGSMLFWGDLSSSVTIAVNDTLQITAMTITLT